MSCIRVRRLSYLAARTAAAQQLSLPLRTIRPRSFLRQLSRPAPPSSSSSSLCCCCYSSSTRVHYKSSSTLSSSSSSSTASQPSPSRETLPPESEKKVQALLDRILDLDLIEVHLLTQLVNRKMGMDDASLVQQQQMSGPSSQAQQQQQQSQQQEEEAKPTTVDLKLTGFDAKSKIKVIKEVRSIAELGLKEAKELVEGAPKVIKKDLKPEEAEELKQKLEAVGAEVELS